MKKLVKEKYKTSRKIVLLQILNLVLWKHFCLKCISNDD